MKKLWLLVLLVGGSAEAQVDVDISVPEVLTFASGAQRGTASFRYLWLQGTSLETLRQVGETPDNNFWRLDLTGVQCFAVQVINVENNSPPGTPRRILGTSDRGPVNCQDFSLPPPTDTIPSTPGAPVFRVRPQQ